MGTFLGIVLGGILIYFLCMFIEHTEKKKTKEKDSSWNRVLPQYIGKHCEITVKDPLVYIDIMHSVKGLLLDVDDEWIMLECKGKKTIKKILRISNISSVKEII